MKVRVFSEVHHITSILYPKITKFITDEEMFSVAVMLCMKRHNTKELCLLSAKDKIEIARIMHSEYNANNRQIRNILRLDRGIVDNMFQ